MAAVIALRRSLAISNPCRIFSTLRNPVRTFSTTAPRKAANGNNDDSDSERPSMPFKSMPSPPRLSKEEQEIFERLQKQSTGAFSTPRTPPKVNQSPSFKSEESDAATEADESTKGSSDREQQFHRDFKGTLSPEFEGAKNPKTGELGGPKNEPLRWGAKGDWSYGGRVTDF